MARLDNYLVEHNFAESRNKAQALIKDELVSINGKIINKSSFKVEAGDEVKIEQHKCGNGRVGVIGVEYQNVHLCAAVNVAKE